VIYRKHSECTPPVTDRCVRIGERRKGARASLKYPHTSSKAIKFHLSPIIDRYLKGITKVGASRHFSKRVSTKIKKTVEKGGGKADLGFEYHNEFMVHHSIGGVI
jgi:hypothetical protein